MTNEQEIRPIPVVTAFCAVTTAFCSCGAAAGRQLSWTVGPVSAAISRMRRRWRRRCEVREETGLQVDDVVLRAVADPLLNRRR